jgi:hypothetical protein
VFEYDRLSPLEAEVASVETRASGQHFDLSYRVADDELVSAEQTREFAPYAAGLNLLKVYDSATHLQMFFDSVAREDRISWLHSKPG